MERNSPNDDLILDYTRRMMPSLLLSLKSDIMECKVAWCRFASAKFENLDRPKHRHLVYEIHYILDGVLNYRFPQFGEFSAKKGEFMLIPRDTLHFTSNENERTEYLDVAFLMKSNDKAINIIFSKGNKPICSAFTPAMEGLIAALKMKTHENYSFEKLSTELIVHSILLETVDEILDSLGLKLTYKNAAVYDDPRVSNIERIVNANKYSQKLRGEDVAEELKLTTRQLNRICNQNFGCSINQYITNGRVESMKELLSQSCYTLLDIAFIFGFTDVYAFIKHFTKYAGISPGKYRMSINSSNDFPAESE